MNISGSTIVAAFFVLTLGLGAVLRIVGGVFGFKGLSTTGAVLLGIFGAVVLLVAVLSLGRALLNGRKQS